MAQQVCNPKPVISTYLPNFAMYMMIFQSAAEYNSGKPCSTYIFNPFFFLIILGGRILIIFRVPDPPLGSTFVSLSFVKYVDFQLSKLVTQIYKE